MQAFRSLPVSREIDGKKKENGETRSETTVEAFRLEKHRDECPGNITRGSGPDQVVENFIHFDRERCLESTLKL